MLAFFRLDRMRHASAGSLSSPTPKCVRIKAANAGSASERDGGNVKVASQSVERGEDAELVGLFMSILA